MAIFGISDLHLSFGVDKPMNIFGKVWQDYELKLESNWKNQVKEDDIVIIAGDISWGIDFKEAKPDFEFISNLPGKKIILKGNHDYYFSTKTKVENFFKDNNYDILVLHNNAIDIGKYILCGTRGWGVTDGTKIQDKKIIDREEQRLILSLNQAKDLQKLEGNEAKEILVAMHFPPFSFKFKQILEENQVKKCIYGHLHGFGHSQVREGKIDGVEYHMVGCDYTKFKLIEL